MTTIVTRVGKGSPLTHVEMDTNLTNLNTSTVNLETDVAALETTTTILTNDLGTLTTAVNTLTTTKASLSDLNASSGSTLIGFIQAGTGAVAQTEQSKLRQYVTPLDFGAIGNGSADDTTALQLAFNYVFAGNGVYTLDLAGRKYMTTAPIVGTSSYQFYKRTIKNGWIEAKSTFVGSYLIDFSASYSGNQVTDFRMIDVTLQGGAAGAGSGGTYYADGAIIFGETYGVTILNCILQGFNGSIIKSTDTGAANEINVIATRIAGLGTNPTGIDLAGNDSLIEGCLIRECTNHVRFRKGSNTLVNSHLYNFEKPASAGVVCDYARQIQMIGNYIDTVWLELTDPQDCLINSNKFLLPNGTTTPGWTTSITFDGSSASVVNVTNDTIAYTGHNYRTGNPVVYTTTGTEITGLTSGTTYYIIRVDANTLKLAASSTDATAGTAVNLTAVGVGITHVITGAQAFIDLNTVPAWGLVNFNVQGNTFVCQTGTTPDSIRSASGTMTSYTRVNVRNNAFSNVTQRASHQRVIAAISGATSQTLDFSTYAFGGNSFQYGIAGFQGATGGPVNRLSRTGNVFTVTLGAASTGTVIVDASMNIDGQ